MNDGRMITARVLGKSTQTTGLAKSRQCLIGVLLICTSCQVAAQLCVAETEQTISTAIAMYEADGNHSYIEKNYHIRDADELRQHFFGKTKPCSMFESIVVLERHFTEEISSSKASLAARRPHTNPLYQAYRLSRATAELCFLRARAAQCRSAVKPNRRHQPPHD